jgi:hypothetical protein
LFPADRIVVFKNHAPSDEHDKMVAYGPPSGGFRR